MVRLCLQLCKKNDLLRHSYIHDKKFEFTYNTTLTRYIQRVCFTWNLFDFGAFFDRMLSNHYVCTGKKWTYMNKSNSDTWLWCQITCMEIIDRPKSRLKNKFEINWAKIVYTWIVNIGSTRESTREKSWSFICTDRREKSRIRRDSTLVTQHYKSFKHNVQKQQIMGVTGRRDSKGYLWNFLLFKPLLLPLCIFIWNNSWILSINILNCYQTRTRSTRRSRISTNSSLLSLHLILIFALFFYYYYSGKWIKSIVCGLAIQI